MSYKFFYFFFDLLITRGTQTDRGLEPWNITISPKKALDSYWLCIKSRGEPKPMPLNPNEIKG